MAYGKFFDKKAGFISIKWLPYFVNHRRDGYDFDALWDDGKASRKQKLVMDLFAGDLANEEYLSNDLKTRAGFGKDAEKGYEGVISKLQMQMYLCMRDFRQRKNKKGEAYGWPVAVYTTPEHVWGYEHITSAYKEKPEESAKRIADHIKDVYPVATDAMIKKVMGV